MLAVTAIPLKRKAASAMELQPSGPLTPFSMEKLALSDSTDLESVSEGEDAELPRPARASKGAARVLASVQVPGNVAVPVSPMAGVMLAAPAASVAGAATS
jgi:hypothetical protein